jgi:hypothetical protein
VARNHEQIAIEPIPRTTVVRKLCVDRYVRGTCHVDVLHLGKYGSHFLAL